MVEALWLARRAWNSTQIDAYHVGGKYAFTPALTTGIGYTYMNIGGGSDVTDLR